MIHPDEGSLRALLDEETGADQARALRTHLAGCADCAAALDRTREVGARAASLLGALDVAPPTERVRARLAATKPSRRWLRPADLARAAALVIGFAGMVTAAVHPASPLHRWLAGGATPVAEAPPPGGAASPTLAAAAPSEVGVRIAASPAGVSVSLSGAAAGTPIEVTWVERDTAAVYAAVGTSFSTSESEGRIDAAAVAGPVRVELPRGAARASVVVAGRVYLDKAGERIDYPGPPALVDGPRVRFEVR